MELVAGAGREVACCGRVPLRYSGRIFNRRPTLRARLRLAAQSMSDPTTPRPAHAAADEISLWEVLAVLVRRRWTIVLTTLLVGAMAGGYAHLRPLTYTTRASFRPQGSEASNSQLMALASQFGVNVGAAGGDEASPAFYQELLTSREILRRVSDDSFDVEGMGSVHLKDLLEIDEPTEAERDEEVLEWLREEAVAVSTGRETGTVTISVQTQWPDLSQAIAAELLAEVALFNMSTRQSQAASERAFIETRVEAAEAELESAEEELRLFLEANRQWENSPLLTFQHDGLMREVTLRQSVLTTLVQSYEQARISEVRDTPVITVLQSPFLPPTNDPRNRSFFAALGIVLGGMVGIVLAFLVEAFRRPGDRDPARQDFDASWNAAVASVPFIGRGRA